RVRTRSSSAARDNDRLRGAAACATAPDPRGNCRPMVRRARRDSDRCGPGGRGGRHAGGAPDGDAPHELAGGLAPVNARLRYKLAVEVRLLAVPPRHRKQAVFVRLAGLLAVHFRQQGCDLALISGTTREIRLYRHLGFVPFGPLVGSEQAPYQPMVLTLESF